MIRNYKELVNKLLTEVEYDEFTGTLLDNYIFYMDDGYIIATEKAVNEWESDYVVTYTRDIRVVEGYKMYMEIQEEEEE